MKIINILRLFFKRIDSLLFSKEYGVMFGLSFLLSQSFSS